MKNFLALLRFVLCLLMIAVGALPMLLVAIWAVAIVKLWPRGVASHYSMRNRTRIYQRMFGAN